MRDVETEWNNNCDDHLKKIGLRGKKNDESRVEIYRVMDDLVKSEFRSKDEAKEVVEKLREAAK